MLLLYKKYIEIKRKIQLLKLQDKKQKNSSILIEIEKNKEELISIKIELRKLKIKRNLVLIEKYNLTEYIRKDGQLINLKKLQDDIIYDKILEDTKFFKGSILVRMFILVYDLSEQELICESSNCFNTKTFNKSTNFFNTFCDCVHDDKHSIRQQKLQKTIFNKYGVTNQNQIKNLHRNNKVPHVYKDRHHQQLNITNYNNYNKAYIKKHFILPDETINLLKFCEYFNINKITAYNFLKLNNIDFKSKNGISRAEQEVADFIKSLDVDIKQSDRTLISPLELDIIIPDHNIAIEFNGLYWHSYGLNNTNYNQGDLKYNKNRHVKKTEACENKNFQLFHIFENEWDNKKNIWKSQIRNALGKCKYRLGARECYIKEIDNSLTNNFLDINHLQGKCQSSIRLGLFSKVTDELVSVMTFGKSRFNKNIDFELIRFCSKLNLQVPGAASKLLKHFEINYKPNGLISYANRRWSTGHLYKTLNFKVNTISNPNYFYFKNNDILYSRVKFQKHKLEKQLEVFDPLKTEMQNMIEDGYRSIYDAGNLSFIKSY